MVRFLGFGAAAIALLLVTSTEQLNAQQEAQAPGQPPEAAQAEPDEKGESNLSDWRNRMRDWMMGEERESGRMMGWGAGSGPGAMWGGGMPMHGRMMPIMMVAMMDTNGNGSLSYEEIEAVHQRMFNLLDEDKDGELSADEIQEMMGWPDPDR